MLDIIVGILLLVSTLSAIINKNYRLLSLIWPSSFGIVLIIKNLVQKSNINWSIVFSTIKGIILHYLILCWLIGIASENFELSSAGGIIMFGVLYIVSIPLVEILLLTFILILAASILSLVAKSIIGMYDVSKKGLMKMMKYTIGIELKGKILGLIGLGKVGSQVAKVAKAFGMQVMAWSENLDLDKCKELDVLPSTKEDLISNSDFLSIHVQGGERYKDCIKLKEFDMMKRTAFLINTSRGPIVNEDDLIIALSTNVIAGAGIDVYEKEPLPSEHKLRFLPNALILPHLGYVTAENYSIFYTQMFENLEYCVLNKPIRKIE